MLLGQIAGGDNDNRNRTGRLIGPHRLKDGRIITLPHHQIEDNYRRMRIFDQRDNLPAACCLYAFMSLLALDSSSRQLWTRERGTRETFPQAVSCARIG
jgi:hypothetical protein